MKGKTFNTENIARNENRLNSKWVCDSNENVNKKYDEQKSSMQFNENGKNGNMDLFVVSFSLHGILSMLTLPISERNFERFLNATAMPIGRIPRHER